MRTLLILVGITMLVLFAGLTTCGYKLYQAYDNYPEEAKFENIKSRYRDLVAELDNAIASTDSVRSLEAALDEINYPPDTLKVAMIGDGLNTRVINSRLKNASYKLRIAINNGGYGQMGRQAYWIFQYPLDKYEYDSIEIFFERELPEK